MYIYVHIYVHVTPYIHTCYSRYMSRGCAQKSMSTEWSVVTSNPRYNSSQAAGATPHLHHIYTYMLYHMCVHVLPYIFTCYTRYMYILHHIYTCYSAVQLLPGHGRDAPPAPYIYGHVTPYICTCYTRYIIHVTPDICTCHTIYMYILFQIYVHRMVRGHVQSAVQLLPGRGRDSPPAPYIYVRVIPCICTCYTIYMYVTPDICTCHTI